MSVTFPEKSTFFRSELECIQSILWRNMLGDCIQ